MKTAAVVLCLLASSPVFGKPTGDTLRVVRMLQEENDQEDHQKVLYGPVDSEQCECMEDEATDLTADEHNNEPTTTIIPTKPAIKAKHKRDMIDINVNINIGNTPSKFTTEHPVSAVTLLGVQSSED